ncbi:MAG: ABC-F family ATP-binding cassette domain-containing protein [Candidatus Zixiibacteriota bacterium]
MTLLSADNITKKYNDQIVFDRVSFTVQQGRRIGLVGRNGSGKTTLFDIMTGRVSVDGGQLNRAGACHIDYIEQEIADYVDHSLFDYVASARSDLLEARREIESVEHHLSMYPNDSAQVGRLGRLQSRFETEGGFTFENEVKLILEGLGFPRSRHAERLRNFSGGEKNRAGLARALAGNGTLLLLDEPTNHLDIESTVWLEEYLTKSERVYVVVSHDRAFLSATVDQVWEISHGKIDFYTGGFDRYLKERDERRRLHEHHYKHQQVEIRRLEEFVRRNIAGQKTKQAQSKLKYLGRVKRLPPPRSDGANMSIAVRSSGRSYAHVLSVTGVSLGFGRNIVLEDADFDIYRGDKVGLIGRNGSGKTTLLRALIGELAPIDGEIKLGANVDVAYFDQELADLDPAATVIDSLWEMEPTAEMGRIRSFLARFGFSGEDCFKAVAALSGGEKTKLSLARLLYHPANFLIFDEPTNHLDLDSREVLESALREFDGSCLIVSHDRHFLDRVVTRILYLHNGALKIFDGNYSYFREKMTPIAEPQKVKSPERRAAYLAFREQSKTRTRHKRRIQSLKSQISNTERELVQIEHDIRENIPKSDWEKLHEASERKKQLEDRLLELYAQLDELDGNNT